MISHTNAAGLSQAHTLKIYKGAFIIYKYKNDNRINKMNVRPKRYTRRNNIQKDFLVVYNMYFSKYFVLINQNMKTQLR